MLRNKIEEFGIPVVSAIDSFNDLESLLLYTKELSGVEGFIIAFEDGQRVKIKADEYVRIHKVKDRIRADRHILGLLLDNQLDDAYPHLDEKDFARVKKYEQDFHNAFRDKVTAIEFMCRDAWAASLRNKKELATKILPNSDIAKRDWMFVYKFADGHDDFNYLVMSHVKSNFGNTAKYNQMAEWLGMRQDQGGSDE